VSSSDVLLLGYTQPPLPDEGTGAHILQLYYLEHDYYPAHYR